VHVVARHLEDEMVLLNLETETYFGLDRVGTRMWDVVSSSPSVEAAVIQLVAEYDADESTIRDDLEALLTQLIESGLAEVQAA
jgi:hypothetical protein